MPPTFPSHMGLIAPLWRRWPRQFDMPALCVGAAMPDVIDGFVFAYRGFLGQSVGHSLVALLLGMPVGFLLWYGLHWLARRVPTPASSRCVVIGWNMAVHAIRAAWPAGGLSRGWLRVSYSLLLGAVSHLLFDALSHGECPWLYPWFSDIALYPDWWHVAWMYLDVPFYPRPYPVGPHLLLWILLGVLGAYLLVKPALRTAPQRNGHAHRN